MTTSFLRFRMRVLSNKGHGSSCFSSFAPVGSFYLLVSSLLPSSPRHFPSPPPFQSHTHTHTRLTPKPFLPLLYDPVLCFFPLLGRLLSRRDFDTHYIAAWRARSDFRRSFSVPVLVLDSGVHEQIHSFPPNLSVWAPFKPPSVPPLFVCPRRLGNISRGLVLSVVSIFEQAKAQKDSRCSAGTVFPRRKGMGMRGCSHLCRFWKGTKRARRALFDEPSKTRRARWPEPTCGDPRSNLRLGPLFPFPRQRQGFRQPGQLPRWTAQAPQEGSSERLKDTQSIWFSPKKERRNCNSLEKWVLRVTWNWASESSSRWRSENKISQPRSRPWAKRRLRSPREKGFWSIRFWDASLVP